MLPWQTQGPGHTVGRLPERQALMHMIAQEAGSHADGPSGAACRWSTMDGHTPLTRAAGRGHVAVVKLLCDWGAEPYIINKVSVCIMKRHSKRLRASLEAG
eukprot:1161661-Pelagomonas_calceolata.AAC.1